MSTGIEQYVSNMDRKTRSASIKVIKMGYRDCIKTRVECEGGEMLELVVGYVGAEPCAVDKMFRKPE